MWRNKSGRFGKRGGFARGKGKQFGSNNQRFSGIQKRDDHRDSNRSGFDGNPQANRDHNRGFRDESRNFDQNRYGRGEFENRGDYADVRDSYPDIHSVNLNIQDEFQDHVVYGDQDDRRNVVEDVRGYREFDNRDDDLYLDNRRPQGLDDLSNRDQEFRIDDDYYSGRETFEFTIDTSARYDGDLRNNLNEQHRQRHEHDVFREKKTGQHHHSGINRNQPGQRSNYGRDEHLTPSGRDGRNNTNWKRDKFTDKKSAYKTTEEKKRYDDKRDNSKSTDRPGTGKGKGANSTRSSSSDRRNSGNKTSATSKDNVSKMIRKDSNTRNKDRSETASTHDHKKSDQKNSKTLSVTKSNKTSKDENSKDMDKKTLDRKKTHDSSKKNQNKHESVSGTSKKKEDRKQSINKSRADSGSFKKPGDKHSSRQRSNSGRKLDSDIGHIDDEDILSIMADDDGFEKEMKAFSSSGEHSRSKSRRSTERGCHQNASRSKSYTDSRAFERQPPSRENRSKERQQHSREGGSNEQQQHSRDRENKNESRPAFDKRANSSTSKFGSSLSFKDSLESKRPSGIHGNNTNTVSASTNRFRTNFNYGQRHKDNRQGLRPTGRNNNNNLVGRSRFSTASRIKDSYLKRKKSFQGFSNKIFDNRHKTKPMIAHYHSDLSKQQTHGKSEVGVTGAILKDDRISDNKVYSKFRNTDRVSQGFDNQRGDKFNRGFEKFSYSKNVTGNVRGNRFQREGLNIGNKDRFTNRPFKSRDVASQRVKQKYFKGGFSQNRNNNRGFRDGHKDNGRQKRKENKHWDRKSVVDKEKHSDVIQDDVSNIEPLLDDQTLDLNPQQVIFIPNNDQPHMVDQFGQIIINPEMDVQQGEDALPLQYIPQQFHHSDRVPQGEQVVFIPFVNNQGPPDYTGNIPLTYNDSNDILDVDKPVPDKKKGRNLVSSGSRVTASKKKPLSVQARAKLKRSLEIKRKQRMEKEIEKKLLKKLLSNPDVNKVVRESKNVKKKPLIKRISPPSASHQSNKQYKLVKRDNNTSDLDDVSEDEAKYDNVSDLEDVSENEDAYEVNDEYDSRQAKRPVFRKPGQPRINKNVTDASRDVMIQSTSGDVRRVVNNSSIQQSSKTALQSNKRSPRMNQVDSVQKLKQGDKSRRSVYIESPKDKVESNVAMKRTNYSSGYETGQIKKRRSMSPIEITVSNDRFSKGTYRNSESDKDYMHYESSYRKDDRKLDYRQNYSEAENFGERFERTKNERDEEYEKGIADRYRDERETKTIRYGDKTSRMAEKNSRDENRFRKERNLSNSDTDERSKDKEQRNKGKYVDNKSNRRGNDSDDNRNRKNENYNVKDSKGERGDTLNDKWRDDSNKRGGSWEGRNDRRKEKNREFDRNERKGSFSGDASLSDDRNSGRNNQRHGRDRDENQDLGTNRNLQGNNFVSKMNQPQFQINQPMMQQSMQSQPFISSQSPSIPLQGQTVMQFAGAGSSVDHSLPPVQNSQMSMPQFAQHSMGVRPDMSLPPPVMNVVGTPTSMGTMVIQQQPQFQQQPMQQMNVQQQQQQFQNIQPQFQQQQQPFQQMQTQPQMIPQQTNSPNFQTHQPAFQTNLHSNQQMSLQPMQSGQYQQTQSGVNMMSVNQNQQTGSMVQGQRGSNQQGISTSGTIQHYVAATPQQAVRGVIGTIKPSVDSSKMIRGQQVRSGIRNQVSNSQTMSRRQGTNRQSNYSPGRRFDNYNQGEEENEGDEDEFMEMLCSKCDKVFLSHEVMRRHGNWHDKVENNTKSWRCDHCEQGFLSSSSHADHMLIKHSLDSWNCSLCDKTFGSSFALDRHVRLASHKDLKVKFVCSLCPASFMVLTHLVHHKKENHHSGAGYSFLRKY
ncbi:putative uncharacterized protein DDB_G0282133 [Ruditapes philippinarum]|uniref:putative uncharacterized protein DDB_G0282133 n=1 Tax=Ruditapes philippinarum TaxID=129788 RepID=UPI00295BCDAB|nr:putative uncharacterized protein DDB_G0282133 [Ruditapes philippinarum]